MIKSVPITIPAVVKALLRAIAVEITKKQTIGNDARSVTITAKIHENHKILSNIYRFVFYN